MGFQGQGCGNTYDSKPSIHAMLQHLAVLFVFFRVSESPLISAGIPWVEVTADLLVRLVDVCHVDADIAIHLLLVFRRICVALVDAEGFTQTLCDPSGTALEAHDLRAWQFGHLRQDLNGRRTVANDADFFAGVIV